MRLVPILQLRFRSLFTRQQVEGELDEELQYHLQRLVDENVAAGMSPTEARHAARRSMRDLEQRKEECRDMRQLHFLENSFQDLRYGLRTLLRTPGLSAIAILSLALGIGANTAIFSLIDRILVSLLPVKQPQRLVLFDTPEPYFLCREFRARSTVFSDVAGTASLTGVAFNGSDLPENTVTGRLVTGNYFRTLGVSPLRGRTFSEAENDAGPHPDVVISDSLWRGRLHSDPEIIGKTIRLGAGRLSSAWGTGGFEEKRPVNPVDRSFTIVGVMPPAFFGETVGERPDFWAPLTMEEHFLPGRHWLSRRTARWVRLIARLQPGVTLPQAEEATNILNRHLLFEAEDHGLTESRRREIEQSQLRLWDGRQGFSDLRSQFAKPLWALLAMVAVVLLIACTNLTNLLLAKNAARRREIATRLALGVGRTRLIRQFLLESALLSLFGAAGSVPLGWMASRALFGMVSAGNPDLRLNLTPDAHILLFTGTLAVLTAFLFGVAPAFYTTRIDIFSALKEAGRTTQSRRSRLAGERLVVTLQVALSTVLLFGTVLFTRTLYNLRAQDLGYSPENLVTARMDPTGAGYQGDEIGQMAQRVLEKLRSTPGIRRASYSDNGLFSGLDSGNRIRVDGFTSASPRDWSARFDQVGPDYFATLGIPLLLGREFTDRDTARAPRVTIINESMAQFYFGHRNPLGATIVYDDQLPLTVVGVSKDVKDEMRQPIHRRFYVPYMQPVDGQMGADFEIRSSLPGAVLDGQIRQAVHAVSPRLHIEFIRPIQTAIDSSMMSERLVARLSILFGCLALLLGFVGLYGVMAYSVARRTAEIGIRIALGGRPVQIIGNVLADTALIVILGLCVGLPSALALSGSLQSLLFGLQAADGWSLLLVISLIAVVTLIASIVPTRRALRIDPVLALRCE